MQTADQPITRQQGGVQEATAYVVNEVVAAGVSQAADLLGLPHGTVSRVYREREEILSEQHCAEGRCLIDVRGQRSELAGLEGTEMERGTLTAVGCHRGLQNIIFIASPRRICEIFRSCFFELVWSGFFLNLFFLCSPDRTHLVVTACCACSSGGLAAEEPGQRPAGGPLRRHPHAEEEASEHAELHTGPAQERPLETAGPAGRVRAQVDTADATTVAS